MLTSFPRLSKFIISYRNRVTFKTVKGDFLGCRKKHVNGVHSDFSNYILFKNVKGTLGLENKEIAECAFFWGLYLGMG